MGFKWSYGNETTKICPSIILKAPKGSAFFQSIWMSYGSLISPITLLMSQQNWLLLKFKIRNLKPLVASMKEIGKNLLE